MSVSHKMLLAALLAALTLYAQPAPPSPSVPPSDAPTLRITVTLVQVDTVVTDSKGKAVTDLKPEDFELRQDGKLQKITHFSYINTSSGRAVVQKQKQPVDKSAPPLPSVPIKANQVKRTIAMVVDDLGLSFESMAMVRQALKKYVDEQVQPGDLVAIIRTGGGMGSLQQFTSEKRMLYAAIEKLRWNFHGRVGVSSFTPINDSASAEETEADTQISEFHEEQFSIGTLGAINYVVGGLRELPGRKSVVVLSENVPIMQRGQMNDRIKDSLERLTDSANRAGVVIYTIDPRGLPTLSLTASDNVRASAENPGRIVQAQMAKSAKYFDSQDGLNWLADQTGGIFIHDTNDIGKGLKQVLDDQAGYYLLGYSPAQGTFDKDVKNQKFHKISIKVLRPGLHSRTRSGFLGVPDRGRPPVLATRDQQIAAALTSPFGATEIKVRLTSLFGNNVKQGSFVQSLLYIDPKDLKFTEEDDGVHKAVVDIVTMTFGENGVETERNDKTYTIRMKGDSYTQALKNGFVYTVNHPIKKAGAFQLRAVVRDAATKKTGSASRFVEVPDVKKGQLALSGIVVKIAPPGFAAPKPNTAAAQEAVDGQAEASSDGSPAVRRFRTGQAVTYGFQVLNSHMDSKTQKPAVLTEVRVFRDGKPIYSGKLTPMSLNGQTDTKRIINGGVLRLGPKMLPGEYVLQVIATDPMAKDKYRKASNWIDFEVAP